MNNIQIEKGRPVYKSVLMCAGFFGWGDFPQVINDSFVDYDVLCRVISKFYGIGRDQLSRDVVRMAAELAGVPVCETGNRAVFRVPTPRNPKTIGLIMDFFKNEVGGGMAKINSLFADKILEQMKHQGTGHKALSHY